MQALKIAYNYKRILSEAQKNGNSSYTLSELFVLYRINDNSFGVTQNKLYNQLCNDHKTCSRGVLQLTVEKFEKNGHIERESDDIGVQRRFRCTVQAVNLLKKLNKLLLSYVNSSPVEC